MREAAGQVGWLDLEEEPGRGDQRWDAGESGTVGALACPAGGLA